jgi:hypothetical protein
MSASKLHSLSDRWSTAKPAERANFQSYLIELCSALGVEPPRPAGSKYEFEYAIDVVSREGKESTNFIDLYKANHFALEAKDEEPGRSTDILLTKAFGQVRQYVGYVPHERPPYLMVLDVGKTLIIWDRWNGDYGGYSAGRRIDLTRLDENPETAEVLVKIWTNPSSLDPRSRATKVTRELAEKLAGLATALEGDGFSQERVARFLMRCVFTMFAEHVELLLKHPFRSILDDVAVGDPKQFVPLAEELWRAMDVGDPFMLRKLLRFNGHFFEDSEALPLNRDALAFLLEAAKADWAHVEPSIFGTLLTRALDPQERHKLGAEFTPREYVEKVVRPTVEEPIRARWTAVQAEVLQLQVANKKGWKSRAEKRLRSFHDELRKLQFLDPACGSGNFLYVTMHLVKRIELEVIRAIEDITGKHEMRFSEVGPRQFHGIEVKSWAREIAELVLWIGFHQFWKEHHNVQPPEPILQNTGTLEYRDAVLAWDSIRRDPSRDRPDPSPRIRDRVTGRLVPDREAVLKYQEYVHPTQAKWPRADYIIGNPPYLGKQQKRKMLGDGYVDALQAAYPEVPPAADFVMCWWYRAAELVARGRVIRAGLITTNSIRQRQNRSLIEAAQSDGARVIWAVADHPWVDGADGAAVRVAMTVVARDESDVVTVSMGEDGREVVRRGKEMNSDLTVGADVVSAGKEPLLSNKGLATVGVKLYGDGFILDSAEAQPFLRDSANREVLREFFNGRDLTTRPRGAYLIDFGTRSERQAAGYAALFDIVRSRVKPDRDANPNEDIRDRWWQLGHNRAGLREALVGLSRYIVTPETAKHRFFQFLPASATPEGSLFCFGLDDSAFLAILSSSAHTTWANRAAGAMGKGNDPRYNKSCFDAFPFPELTETAQARLRTLGDELDSLRKKGMATDDVVTMTRIYNVVEKLRSNESLDPEEQRVFSLAACGSIKDLHDEIDAIVRDAYEWSHNIESEEMLFALIELHDKRRMEEEAAEVRWLRPEYQLSRFGEGIQVTASGFGFAPGPQKVPSKAIPWPSGAVEQISAIKATFDPGPLTVEEVIARFKAAKRELVRRHVETLALMGELRLIKGDRYMSTDFVSK